MLINQSLLPLQTTAQSFFFNSNDKSAKAKTKSKFTIHCFHTVTHYAVHSFSAGKGLHYNHRVVYINIGQALKCVTLKVINYQSAITMTYQDFLTRVIMKLVLMISTLMFELYTVADFLVELSWLRICFLIQIEHLMQHSF